MSWFAPQSLGRPIAEGALVACVGQAAGWDLGWIMVVASLLIYLDLTRPDAHVELAAPGQDELVGYTPAAEDLRERGHSSYATGGFVGPPSDLHDATRRLQEVQRDLTAARERAKGELQDIAAAPTQLVLTVDEIAEMLASWDGLPESEEEARDAVESYVEHMRAAEFDVGREI